MRRVQRFFVVLGVLCMALVVDGTAHAASRTDSDSGPDGYSAAVINKGGDGYVVHYTFVDYSSDNVYTEVELTISDSHGVRRIRNVYRGGKIENDSETFTDRGSVSVSLVATFHRVFGEPESNRANPLVVSY